MTQDAVDCDFTLSPCGRGQGEGVISFLPRKQGDWFCPAPLSPTLSRKGRGGQKSPPV